MNENQEKSVIVKRKLRNNFTMVPNAILQNKALSLKAKGLMCYLLSLPDDAEVKKTQLHQQLKDGRDAVISAFNELIESQYIVAEQQIDEGTNQFRYIYTIYDEPQILPEPLLDSRNGFPVTENTEPIYNVLNTNINKIKLSEENKNNQLIETMKVWYEHQYQSGYLWNEEYAKLYKTVVYFIFGKNDLEKPIIEILKLKDQLTFEQFEKLMQAVGGIDHFGSIIDKLEVMLNTPTYLKGKSSLYLTIKKWLKNERK